MLLENTVVFLTGAGRGIGRAMALKLASEGAKVALVSRTENQINEVRDEIVETRGVAMSVPLDINDYAAVEAAADRIEGELGSVNLVANNAGSFNCIGPFWEVDPDAWWQDMTTNVKGAFNCCKVFGSRMRERGAGRLVNVIGGGTGTPFPNGSAYGSSKSALMRFTESIAAELKKSGVIAIAMFPGLVRTSMTELQLESPEGQKWLPRIQDLFAEGRNVPPTLAANLLAEIATGRFDALAGKALDVRHNLDDIEAAIETINSNDELTLRMTGMAYIAEWEAQFKK